MLGFFTWHFVITLGVVPKYIDANSFSPEAQTI